MITRLAESFIRFGSFEIFKPTDPYTGRAGSSANISNKVEMLHTMLRYVIETFYPTIYEQYSSTDTAASLPLPMIIAWYGEVVRRTARLVSRWMSVAWTHAVLNTDNMSIVGITIDYGPFGFMEKFDYQHTPNASDESSRYCYSAQPEICKWNCLKLAEAISLAAPLEQLIEVLEQTYDATYSTEHTKLFRAKLGLIGSELQSDAQLISSLLDTMQETSADFTNTFRALARVQADAASDIDDGVLDYIVSQCATLTARQQSLQSKLHPSQLQTLAALIKTQPDFINQMGANAGLITTELDKMHKRQHLAALTQPQLEQQNRTHWAMWLTQYRQRLTADLQYTVAQQSMSAQQHTEQRIRTQNSHNPRYVMRNYLAQRAIDAAEKDDYREAHNLFRVLTDPYDMQQSDGAHSETQASAACLINNKYNQPGVEFQCSCSS